jgi:hypothetical protein
VAEAQGQFGNRKEGERLALEVYKLVQSNSSEGVTVDTCVCNV